MDPDDNSASIASNSYSYNKESTHSNSNSFERKMNGDPPQSTLNGYRSGSNNNTSSRNHRNHRDHYRDQYRDEPRNNYSNGGQHRKTSTTKRSDQYGDTTNQNKNRQRSKSSTRRRDHDKEKYSSYDESDNNNHPRKFNDNVDNDDDVTHLRSLSTMDTKTFRRLRDNRREIIGINGGGDSRRRRGVGGSSNSVFSYDTRDTAGSSGTSATPINGKLLRSSSRGGRGWSRRSKRNSNTTTSSRRYLPWQAVIIIGLGIVTLIKTGLIELKLENHTRLLLNGEKEIDLQNYLRGVPQLITGGKIGGGSSRTLESQIVNNEEYFAEPNIGDSKDWGSEVDGTGSRDSLEALDTLDDDGEDKKGKDEFGYAAVVGGGSPSSLSYQSPSQGMVGGSSLGSSSSQGYNQPTYSNQLQQGAGSSSQQYGNQGFVSQGGGVPIQNYGVASPLLAAADVNQFTQQQQQQQQYGDDGSQQQQQELSAEERLERYKAGNIGGFGSQGGEENTLSSNGSSGNNNAIKGYESGGDSELYFRQALQKTIQHMDRPQIDVEEEDASSFVHPAESNYIIEGEEAESNYKLQAQLKREGEMDVASLGKSAQRQPINGKFENLYSEQREVARMGAINLGFIPPPQQSEGGGTGEDEIDPSAPMTPELLREINKKARTNDRLQSIAQQKLLSAYGGGGEVNGGDATTDDSAKTVSALLNAIENENGMKFDTSDPEKLREQIKAQLKENRLNLEELEGKEEKTHRLKRHHLKRHQNQLYELREELMLAPHAEPIPTVEGKTMADNVGIKADASENGGLTPEEEEEIIRAKKIKDQVARRRQRKINQIKANKKKAAEEKTQLEKSEIGDQVSQGQDQQPNDTADASNVKEEVDENLASVQTAETPQQTDPVPQGQDRQLNDTVEGSIVKEEVAENPATVQGAETPQQIDPVPQGQDPQPNDTADGGTVKEEVAEIPAPVQTAEIPQQIDPVPQGQDPQPNDTADGGTVKEEVAEIPAPVQTAEIPQQIDPVPQGQDPQPNAIADGASDIEKLAENPAPELSAETPQQIDLAPLGQDPQPNTNAVVVNPAPAQSDGTPPQRSVVDGLSDNDPRLWGVTG